MKGVEAVSENLNVLAKHVMQVCNGETVSSIPLHVQVHFAEKCWKQYKRHPSHLEYIVATSCIYTGYLAIAIWLCLAAVCLA